MINLYPLFERNRILKKELLWSLRDYSFAHLALEYQEYSDGILQGCKVEVIGNEIAVGTGIVKYGGFLYLLTEEMRVTYEATQQWEVLKLRMSKETYSEDYIAYGAELFLDQEINRREDELEVCRFKLRQGAGLRDSYKNFADLETEYDTVNHLYASWAGLREETLPQTVIRTFAQEILSSRESKSEDVHFAYFCLNQSGSVAMDIIKDYVSRRLERQDTIDVDRLTLFYAMSDILAENSGKAGNERKMPERRRQILVD